MTPYKNTRLSHDPAIRDLQLQLCDLASTFSSYSEPQEIANQYREVLLELYSLGWDGIISLDCALPLPYMPPEYLERNPDLATPSRNEQWSFPVPDDPQKR